MRYIIPFIVISFFCIIGAVKNTKAQDLENNIEDRIEIFTDTPIDNLIDQDISDGRPREYLFILARPKLFKASITPSYQYTSNAFLDDNDNSDFVASVTAALEFNTVIANQFNVFGNVNASVAQYNEYSSLDYSVFQAGLGGSYKYKSFIGSASYNMSIAYRDFYEGQLVSMHRGLLSVARPFILNNKMALLPYIAGQITPADPTDFGFYKGEAGAQFLYKPRHNIVVKTHAVIGHKEYFDYFETLLQEERKDTSYTVDSSITWNIKEGVSLSGDISFTHNNSTLNTNDYDVFTATPSLKLSIRF